MNFIMKVDRVSSLSEAQELQNLGVDLICVSLESDSRFKDKRYLSIEDALKIKDVLKTSKLVLELCPKSKELLSAVKEVNPDFVQFVVSEPVSPGLIKQLNVLGCKIIYSGLEASYDDDPSWIFSGFAEMDNISNTLFQLDLIPDVENSWSFLKNECPKYPEELQILDIENLAQKFPVIVTSQFSREQLEELKIDLPSVKGAAFVLGNEPVREDFNYYKIDKLLKILLEN